MPLSQPSVHSFFTNLTKTFSGKYLCLADSGMVVLPYTHGAIKTSAVRDGAPRVYSYPLHAVDRTLVGLMGPPFQLITLSDHLLFHSLF